MWPSSPTTNFARLTERTWRELLAGGLWLVATILPEFGLGLHVMDTAWNVLLADNDSLAGRVWVPVPVAPWPFGRYLKW